MWDEASAERHARRISPEGELCLCQCETWPGRDRLRAATGKWQRYNLMYSNHQTWDFDIVLPSN